MGIITTKEIKYKCTQLLESQNKEIKDPTYKCFNPVRNLKILQKCSGLNKRDFCTLIGISESTYTKVCRHERSLPFVVGLNCVLLSDGFFSLTCARVLQKGGYSTMKHMIEYSDIVGVKDNLEELEYCLSFPSEESADLL